MKLTSSAFNNNGFMPSRYTCDGQNISPPLTVSEVPEDARSLVLIMDDPDIPDFVKEKYGIPYSMRSCHTTVIGDYFVEGHVPIEAVEKLMLEKPDIKGIALPGMPSGSPGMPGSKQGPFIVYAINKDGSTSEFMRI